MDGRLFEVLLRLAAGLAGELRSEPVKLQLQSHRVDSLPLREAVAHAVAGRSLPPAPTLT